MRNGWDGWAASAALCLAFIIAGGQPARAAAGSKYAPSGDALYDRYAQLLLSGMHGANWNAGPPSWLTDDGFGTVEWLPTADGGTQQPKLLDGAEVLRWERDFKHDPRYWELRLMAVSSGTSDESQARRRADLDKLDALCTLGEGDEGAYYLLYANAATRMDQAKDTLEELQLAVCERAIKQFPDNSFWYFMQGRLLIELGEPEQALAALKLANAAPQNTWPQPFPHSTLFDPKYRASQAEGNRIARGAIYLTYTFNLPNYIRIKESYKNTTLMLALGGDPALADELIKMAGRMSRMQQITPNFQVVASALPPVICKYASEELLTGPPASDPDLQRLAQLFDDFKQQPGEPDATGPPFGSSVKAPQTAYQKAALQMAQSVKITGTPSGPWPVYKGLPALVKEDWLRFDEDFEDGQKQLVQNAPFFAVVDNPPLARLFAGEQASYRSELETLRAKSRTMREKR